MFVPSHVAEQYNLPAVPMHATPNTPSLPHRVVRGQAGLQIHYEQAIEQLQGGEHMQVRQIFFLQSILFKMKWLSRPQSSALDSKIIT